jgi:hypothetical protein
MLGGCGECDLLGEPFWAQIIGEWNRSWVVESSIDFPGNVAFEFLKSTPQAVIRWHV